jgi:NAD(P)-dependent dehydrogenase (short-subunit alcohol dehydrogenase family)
MGTYVITGGVNGIGKATADLLRRRGQTVCVRTMRRRCSGDLGKTDGRAYVAERIHQLFPEGIDGLACIAGISFPKPDNSSILSVNYFGTVAVAEGLFDLLKKKKGSCVLTASASVTWVGKNSGGHVAELLTDCGDEERIARLVNSFAPDAPYNMYLTSKLALARWARRNSAQWAMEGVRLSVVAPGCVDTRLGNAPPGAAVNESFHQTIPGHYGDLSLMAPEELAEVNAFLLSESGRGIIGSVIYADSGQETFYNMDKVYF